MGQRHQVYIVRKTKDGYRGLSAHHHQWCYGLTGATKLIRLVEGALKAKTYDDKWSEYSFTDPREMDVLVKSVYGVSERGFISMVHNENDCLIDESSNIRPELGDNNDGCGLVVIDEIKKEVRGCLFTPGHVEGKHGKAKKWTAWTPEKYLSFYYTDAELSRTTCFEESQLDTLKNNKVKSVSQVEFNKIMAAAIGERKLKAVI